MPQQIVQIEHQGERQHMAGQHGHEQQQGQATEQGARHPASQPAPPDRRRELEPKQANACERRVTEAIGLIQRKGYGGVGIRGMEIQRTEEVEDLARRRAPPLVRFAVFCENAGSLPQLLLLGVEREKPFG